MNVIKRSGKKEEMLFEKIQRRIDYLVQREPRLSVNVPDLTMKVIQGLYDGIPTSTIDMFTAQTSASLSIQHRDYSILAARVLINNHHKNTFNSFSEKIRCMSESTSLLDEEFVSFVLDHAEELDSLMCYDRDYDIDFFGFRTLENGYLLRLPSGEIVERPQDLFMRVAVQLYMPDIKDIQKVYDRMSERYYVHATPTLYNAGKKRAQMASCFLMSSEDSMSGIMESATECALISKFSGGIGLHISSWRGANSYINGTNGYTNGIMSHISILDRVAHAFNQGGGGKGKGKRPGSISVYLEPHHADIFEFLQMRLKGGIDTHMQHIFPALWISDLFMERIETDGMWSLFSPDECPDLHTTWGDEYKRLYEQYERDGKARQTVRAREVLKAIYLSQKECGMPYILYKDHANRHSNQQNLGTIQSSNLCSEIILYSDAEETSVCNLASICLPQFVKDTYIPEEDVTARELNHEFPRHAKFNYLLLAQVARELVFNLNQVIDRNWYPNEKTKRSNFRHRPIGIGIQGLADVFLKCNLPFESCQALEMNRNIMEAIYYGALSASNEIARKRTLEGCEETTYPSYKDSPISQGILHFDSYRVGTSPRFDWESLRMRIQRFGIRNSQLIALMPTASTSQIMGCSSCFEPYQTNVFTRKTSAGEYIVMNKYLMKDIETFQWPMDLIRTYLLQNNGSILGCPYITDDYYKLKYKTAWEIRQKHMMDLAVTRQPFVDQSQSMNLFITDFSFQKMYTMQLYAWKNGLKTGVYYTRTRPATMAQKFTLSAISPERESRVVDDEDEENICIMCSS